jgi:hypothetical protein
MILLIAAGKVFAATLHLAQQTLPVQVLTRDPERVDALAQADVEVFPGDLYIRQSIDEAVRGSRGVDEKTKQTCASR